MADLTESVAAVVAAAGAGTSVEKVQRIVTDVLPELQPVDEAAAQRLQVLGLLAPQVLAFLPADPDVLDAYLGAAADVLRSLRSDEPPAEGEAVELDDPAELAAELAAGDDDDQEAA
jgi:hypothetical protein